MNALEFRLRVSVLWMSVVGAMLASLLFLLFIPGAVEDLLAGEIEGETLTDGMGFMFAGMGILPLVMVVVTLLAGDRVSRWANLIVGLVVGGFVGVFGVISHLAAGPFNAHILLGGVAGALAFLIAGLSVAALRQPQPQLASPAPEQSRHRETAGV